MTDSRAQTSYRLATLDEFLESQRQLLARTQSDLHKLTELRERALADPQAFIENVEDELDDPAYRMSEYQAPQKPEGINWELFASHDPSPFTTIPLPGPPPVSAATKQLSPPSELQTFVREASSSILADFKPFFVSEIQGDQETGSGSGADEDGDADVDADEQRLAELVKYGKNANPVPQTVEMDVEEPAPPRRRVGSGLRLKPSRETVDPKPGGDVTNKGKGKQGTRESMQIGQPVKSFPAVQQRPKRNKKPNVKPQVIYKSPSPLPVSRPPLSDDELPPLPDAFFGTEIPELIERAPHSDSNSASDVESEDVESDADTRPKLTRPKAKRRNTRRLKAPSETFNLPWTLSEQHQLEKLLEEIPAGEKHRWARISKAMSGKRTPRQVASRVQKYFEKLKKFGVEAG